MTDASGVKRIPGERWLMRKQGQYLIKEEEELVKTVKGVILTEQKALHLKATASYTDVYNIKRNAGDEWLVKSDMASTHILDVYEEKVQDVPLTLLTSRDYCFVRNPIDPKTGECRWGEYEQRKGPLRFFLQPGEAASRERGNFVQRIMVLGEDEAIFVKALDKFTDEKGVERKACEEWMVHGPCDYIPPLEIEVIEDRKSIPLDENEGIYVQDLNTGQVRIIKGQTYMLQAQEKLWSKPLNKEVIELIYNNKRPPSH